ncbi:hypothetical protein Q5O89_16765 [Peribacillus frigoritolerans]|nr:hypothetical protein [Peribacillus frigoritolerans]
MILIVIVVVGIGMGYLGARINLNKAHEMDLKADKERYEDAKAEFELYKENGVVNK